MRYIEAPNEYTRDDAVTMFLAGGITGCPDWQSFIVHQLAHTSLTLFNPRRADFPINDPSAAEAQVTWEYEHLRHALTILFWFPCETICPIALYELGAWSMTNKPLFVGVHRDYARRKDVEIQMRLARPDVFIVYGLPELVHQVLKAKWVSHDAS